MNMRMTDFPLITEVAEAYIYARNSGLTRDEATQKLMLDYQTEITVGSEDDGILFWIGLADGQYKRKELSIEIAERGLEALARFESMVQFVVPNDIARRRTNYSRAPMPERTVRRSNSIFRCKWKVGDVFCFPLNGHCSQDYGLIGKFALLRKIADVEFGDGRLFPVVTLHIWEKPNPPQSANEIYHLPPLIVNGGPKGMRNGRFEYRVELLIKNDKEIEDSTLRYLGNAPDYTMPENEIVFVNAEDMVMIHLYQFELRFCGKYKVNQFFVQGNQL